MGKIQIILDPEGRERHIANMLALDGLGDVREDREIGYGAIALTGLGSGVSSANEQIKTYLGRRQSILAAAMKSAGVTLYDPASAPYSPDKNLESQPNEIFMVDSARVAIARHVTFVDVLASTGAGIELEKARRLGKFVYVFHDPHIRTSRMQPDRAFHLCVGNFSNSQRDFASLFSYVNEFDPAIGFDDGVPCMIGVHRITGLIVNLEKAVRENWPDLAYYYDGNVQILIMACQTPNLFMESKPMKINVYQYGPDHKVVVMSKEGEITDLLALDRDGREIDLNVDAKTLEDPLLWTQVKGFLIHHYEKEDEDMTLGCFRFAATPPSLVNSHEVNSGDGFVLVLNDKERADKTITLIIDTVSGCRVSKTAQDTAAVQGHFDKALGHDNALALW